MSLRIHTARLVVIAAGLGFAVFLRGRILEERRALELVPRAGLGEAAGAPEAMAGRRVVLLSAGLGVFRALALDFLWLRAVHLQEKGEYFEAGALAKLITGLEPRLPDVWCFQAHNLAYDIPPSFPLGERYPWVVRGIQLLRDDALVYNPESPTVVLDLAFIFQHKIGLDLDDAGYLYRSALASVFEVERDSPRGRDLWREWRLDEARVKRLEARLGVTLDFRAAESHALYWAEKGLESGLELDSWLRHRLGYVWSASLRQLFDGGRPVRTPGAKVYAFVPDLRFLSATDRALHDDLEKARVPEDRLRALAAFEATAVVYLFLSGDDRTARTRFDQVKSRLDRPPATLEDLLVRWITTDGRRTEAAALDDSLDAAVLLERAGEATLADGLKRIARILDARLARSEGAAATPFEERLRAAAARREAGTRPGELPFRLELLAADELAPPNIPPPSPGQKDRD